MWVLMEGDVAELERGLHVASSFHLIAFRQLSALAISDSSSSHTRLSALRFPGVITAPQLEGQIPQGLVLQSTEGPYSSF